MSGKADRGETAETRFGVLHLREHDEDHPRVVPMLVLSESIPKYAEMTGAKLKSASRAHATRITCTHPHPSVWRRATNHHPRGGIRRASAWVATGWKARSAKTT